MKKILVLIFVVITVIKANSQSSGELSLQNYQARALVETHMMNAKLALTNQQKDSVLQINKHRYESMLQLRSQQQLTFTQRQSQLEAIDVAWKSDLQHILTAAQFQAYQQQQEDALKKMQQRIDSIRAIKKG